MLVIGSFTCKLLLLIKKYIILKLKILYNKSPVTERQNIWNNCGPSPWLTTPQVPPPPNQGWGWLANPWLLSPAGHTPQQALDPDWGWVQLANHLGPLSLVGHAPKQAPHSNRGGEALISPQWRGPV